MKLCFSAILLLIAFGDFPTEDSYEIIQCPAVPARVRGRASHVMRGFDRLPMRPMPYRIELYQPCHSSFDCLMHIAHSRCDEYLGICTCENYHVAYNNTMCLPASLLGYPCLTDHQCSLKVRNSECVEGSCVCQANHIALRLDKCLPPAPVGDYCINAEQCQNHDIYSYCKHVIPRVYGLCFCPEGFNQSADGHCYPKLGQYCEKHQDCEVMTDNSHCKRNGREAFCECREGYEPSSDNTECHEIKVLAHPSVIIETSLGWPCESSEECQARDPHSYCANNTCECISPDSTCSAANTGCHADSFQCRNGYCISWFFVCDSQMNCPDGSDEDQCIRHQCPKEAFQCDEGTCIPRSSVCNGFWECPDGSDEGRCYTGISCDKKAFQCGNGQCLPDYVLCNAVQDCADGSDEFEEICNHGQNCTAYNSFQCENRRCRSSAVLCSGRDGCGDNSDETRCEVCFCNKP